MIYSAILGWHAFDAADLHLVVGHRSGSHVSTAPSRLPPRCRAGHIVRILIPHRYLCALSKLGGGCIKSTDHLLGPD